MRTVPRLFAPYAVVLVLLFVSACQTTPAAHDDLLTPQATSEPTVLTAPNPAPDDGFGWAVALDGTTLAVTEMTSVVQNHEEKLFDVFNGTVHLYEWTGSTWERQQSLTVPDDSHFPTRSFNKFNAPLDNFGQELALDGDTLAVSAPAQTTEYDYDGSIVGSSNVMMYERRDGTWELTQVLYEDYWYEAFGYALALDGDTLAVAKHGDIDIDPRGSVVIYERIQGTWVKQAEFAPWPLDYEKYPYYAITSVHLDGNILAMNTGWSGYVFRRHGKSWRLIGETQGAVTSISNNYIVAGDTLYQVKGQKLTAQMQLTAEGDGGNASAHNAFLHEGALYERLRGRWQVTRVFENPWPEDEPVREFGRGADISDTHIVITAPWVGRPPVPSRTPWETDAGEEGYVLIYQR